LQWILSGNGTSLRPKIIMGYSPYLWQIKSEKAIKGQITI
jgi:hypothetical protein